MKTNRNKLKSILITGGTQLLAGPLERASTVLVHSVHSQKQVRHHLDHHHLLRHWQDMMSLLTFKFLGATKPFYNWLCPSVCQ